MSLDELHRISFFKRWDKGPVYSHCRAYRHGDSIFYWCRCMWKIRAVRDTKGAVVEELISCSARIRLISLPVSAREVTYVQSPMFLYSYIICGFSTRRTEHFFNWAIRCDIFVRCPMIVALQSLLLRRIFSDSSKSGSSRHNWRTDELPFFIQLRQTIRYSYCQCVRFTLSHYLSLLRIQ